MSPVRAGRHRDIANPPGLPKGRALFRRQVAVDWPVVVVEELPAVADGRTPVSGRLQVRPPDLLAYADELFGEGDAVPRFDVGRTV